MKTLDVLGCTIAVAPLGCGTDYIESMFTAMWVEPANLANPHIFAVMRTFAHLPAESSLAAITSRDMKGQSPRNTEYAAVRGMFGSPRSLVEDERFCGKERLGQVEEGIYCQSRVPGASGSAVLCHRSTTC